MSTTFCMPAPGQGKLEQSSVTGLLAVAKRCWVAYITWRIESAAIAHLRAMSDRELDDFLPRQSLTSIDRWMRRCRQLPTYRALSDGQAAFGLMERRLPNRSGNTNGP